MVKICRGLPYIRTLHTQIRLLLGALEMQEIPYGYSTETLRIAAPPPGSGHAIEPGNKHTSGLWHHSAMTLWHYRTMALVCYAIPGTLTAGAREGKTLTSKTGTDHRGKQKAAPSWKAARFALMTTAPPSVHTSCPRICTRSAPLRAKCAAAVIPTLSPTGP